MALALPLHVQAEGPLQVQLPTTPPPSSTGASLTSAAGAVKEAARMVASPIRGLWSAVTGSVLGVERAVAAPIVRFQETLTSDLDRFETLIRRAGFQLTAIDIRNSVTPPAINLVFEPRNRITLDERDALRVGLTGPTDEIGEIERAVVRALLDLDYSIERVRPQRYRVAEVRMALINLQPDVTVTLRRAP